MKTKLDCGIMLALVAWLSSSLSAAAQLRIDFNDRSNDLPLYTLEDFDSFVINSTGGSTAIQYNTRTLNYGTITVSVWDTFGTGCDDRKRTVPVNQKSFTQALLLQDVIFAVDTTLNSGLSIRVQGLNSNLTHQVTLWSYDAGSGGHRVSDWYANGVLVKANYAFDGAVVPVSNDDYRFSFSTTSSATGELLIEGRRNSGSVDRYGVAAAGVFLNAMEISPIPAQGPPCGTLKHFRPGSNLYGWTGGSTFAEQDQEVARLREAGAYRVRINVVWFAVEPSQKWTYDTGLLALYDHLMQRLGENGIKVVFVTADTPYWASSDPAKYTDGSGQHWNSRYKPSNPNDLADYMVFLLNRYQSTGPHAVEIWNEEDASYFWPSGPSAADYVNLLRTSYQAIKAADTNAIVLNGGLTDSSSLSGFMNALYAAGGGAYFDVWSQHVYPRTPQYETAAQTARNVMVTQGDSAKKMWITETGWPTYTTLPNDPSAVSFQRQARYLTNLFTRLATYPYVEESLWYTSRSYDESAKEGSFGLSLPDFTRKPSFFAFSNLVAAASQECPPTNPITLLGLTWLPGGTARVQFSAEAGLSYGLQASSNLGSWYTLCTNVLSTNEIHQFDDLEAAEARTRFYRVVWPAY